MENSKRAEQQAGTISKRAEKKRKRMSKLAYSTQTPEKAKIYYLKKTRRELIMLFVIFLAFAMLLTIQGFESFSEDINSIRNNNASNCADTNAVNSYGVDRTYSLRTVVDMTKDTILDKSIYGNACVQLLDYKNDFVCSSNETIIFYNNSQTLYDESIRYCTELLTLMGMSERDIASVETQSHLKNIASDASSFGFIYINTDISRKAELEKEIISALGSGGSIEMKCTRSNILRAQPYASGVIVHYSDGRISEYTSSLAIPSEGSFSLTLTSENCTVVTNRGDSFYVDLKFLDMMSYDDEEKDLIKRSLRKKNTRLILGDLVENPFFYLKLSKRVTDVSSELLSPSHMKSMRQSGRYPSQMLYHNKILKSEIFGFEYIYLEPISVQNANGSIPSVLDSKTIKEVLQLDPGQTKQVYGTYALQQYSYSYIGDERQLNALRKLENFDEKNVYTVAYVFDYYPMLSAIHQIRTTAVDGYMILIIIWIILSALITLFEFIKLGQRQRQLAESAASTAQREWLLSDRTKSLASTQGELLLLLANDARNPNSFAGTYGDRIYSLLSHGTDNSLVLEKISAALYLSSPSCETSKSTVSLSDIVRETVRRSEPLADKKNIALVMTADSSCRVYADRNLLVRAISYAVLYAIELTQMDGEISIGAHKDAENGTVTLTMKCSAINKEPVISCEPFAKGVGGTGLELYIVKRIVELHSGKCLLEQLGTGVALAIELPSAT